MPLANVAGAPGTSIWVKFPPVLRKPCVPGVNASAFARPLAVSAAVASTAATKMGCLSIHIESCLPPSLVSESPKWDKPALDPDQVRRQAGLSYRAADLCFSFDALAEFSWLHGSHFGIKTE